MQLLLLISFFIFSLASATEKCQFKRRKVSDTSVETESSFSPKTSFSGRVEEGLSLSQVINDATKIFAARPVSEWTFYQRFDIDVFFETPKDREQLPLYLTFLEQILKKNQVYVLDAITGGFLDVTRWYYNRVSGHFMTYFHLIFIRFPLAQFRSFMEYFDEKMLLMPDSNGHNCMHYAQKAHDQEKSDYLQPILAANYEEIQTLTRKFY